MMLSDFLVREFLGIGFDDFAEIAADARGSTEGDEDFGRHVLVKINAPRLGWIVLCEFNLHRLRRKVVSDAVDL